MSLDLEENVTHRDWLATWLLLHRESWRKYANDPANEQILLEGAQQYRPCRSAFDRSFHQNRNAFTRTDGKNEDDDAREAAERQVAQEAELERNVTVDAGDFEYVASLSPFQVSELYHSNPAFARVYRKLMKVYGFNPPAVFGGGLR